MGKHVMKKRYLLAIILLAVSIGAFAYFFLQQPASDIEPKGSSDLIKDIISLATAIVSLLTSIFTFLAARRKEAK